MLTQGVVQGRLSVGAFFARSDDQCTRDVVCACGEGLGTSAWDDHGTRRDRPSGFHRHLSTHIQNGGACRQHDIGAKNSFFAHMHPFHHNATGAHKRPVLHHYGGSLQRLQNPTNAHTTTQMDVGANLGT